MTIKPRTAQHPIAMTIVCILSYQSHRPEGCVTVTNNHNYGIYFIKSQVYCYNIKTIYLTFYNLVYDVFIKNGGR